MAVVRRVASNAGIPKPEAGIGSVYSLWAALEGVGLTSLPLRVEDVAEFLGLEVVTELMDDDISGFLEFRGGRWVVGVNALHHRNRRRFTIAHEIAHFVLHRNSEKRFVDQTFARREGSGVPMENEADRFAAELLMPEPAVRAVIARGIVSLQQLAAEFQVSTLAMKFRVKNLGYSVQ